MEAATLVHTIVNGRYRLNRLLQSDAVSAVFVGDELENRKVVRPVAVHLSRFSDDPSEPPFPPQLDFLSRFHHARVVPFLGAGDVRSGEAAGSLFWVEAIGLESGATRAGAFSRDEVVAMAGSLIELLADLHQSGRLHLNVKPSNLIRMDDGWKVNGLGLVPATPGDVLAWHWEKGTWPWVAPEVLHGEIGPAADVWALGATLQYCLTGRAPFEAYGPAERLQRLLTGSPTLAVPQPPPLDLIIQGCLMRQPERRWSLERVQAWLTGKSLISSRPASAETKRRDRKPAWLGEVRRLDCRHQVKSLAFHPVEPDTLAVGTEDGGVFLWSGDELRWSATLPGAVIRLRWSPDGRLAACLEKAGMHCLRADSGAPEGSALEAQATCSDVAFRDGEAWLAVEAAAIVSASGRHLSVPRVWSLTPERAGTLDGAVRPWPGDEGVRTRPHGGPVLAMQPSAHGLLSAGWDGTLRLGDVVLPGDERDYGIHDAAAGGTVVAAGCDDKLVRVWMDRTSPPALLAGHGGPVYAVSVNADGTVIASGSRDGAVRLWTVMR